jgi:hypothetical protein
MYVESKKKENQSNVKGMPFLTSCDLLLFLLADVRKVVCVCVRFTSVWACIQTLSLSLLHFDLIPGETWFAKWRILFALN